MTRWHKVRYIKIDGLFVFELRVERKKNCWLRNLHNLVPSFVKVCATLEIATLNRAAHTSVWQMRVSRDLTGRERIRRGSPQIARHRLSGRCFLGASLKCALLFFVFFARASKGVPWKKTPRHRPHDDVVGERKTSEMCIARKQQLVAAARVVLSWPPLHESGLNKSSTCADETMSSFTLISF